MENFEGTTLYISFTQPQDKFIGEQSIVVGQSRTGESSRLKRGLRRLSHCSIPLPTLVLQIDMLDRNQGSFISIRFTFVPRGKSLVCS